MGVEDEATILARYANGMTAVFMTSTGDYPGTNRLEITGTKGKLVIENGKLDLDEEIREELLLSFPMRFLCREDCPGLCPKCGKPLSQGDCGCPTTEPDPRLAVLKKLFDKNEEDQ